MNLIGTRRGDEFVDQSGVPTRRSQAWIESVTQISNSSFGTINDRLDELEPQYRTIDSNDSPFQASNNDYIMVDMSVSDVDILVPTEGRFFVTREGSSNDLTIVGTVNGVINPKILFDNTARSFAKFDDGWRVMR